eukprot:403359475
MIKQFAQNFDKHHSHVKQGFDHYLEENLKQKILIEDLQAKIDKFLKFEREKNIQNLYELTNDEKEALNLKNDTHDDVKTLKYLYEKTKKEYHDYKVKIEFKLNELNLTNSLMTIKMKHKQDEFMNQCEKVKELQEDQEQKDLKNALAQVAMFSDDELKKRERLIMKLQDDKGDLREIIFTKEREIKRLQEIIDQRLKDIENLKEVLEIEKQSKNQVDTNKVNLEQKLHKSKQKYYKKLEELKQQKNLTQKFRDMISKLEKELKKGYSNGVVVQYEEMNIDDLIKTQNLFRQPQNIYAINNTTRLSLNYKNNLMSVIGSGVERYILNSWQDESKLNMTSNLRDGKTTDMNSIEEVNFDQISLHMHSLARPTFFNFVENELQRIKNDQQREMQRNESPERGAINRTSNNISDRSFLSIHYEKIKFEPPFRMWLFTTMRAIFDQFVYQWIGKFYFDQKKYMIKSVETFDEGKVDNLRLQLLIGLQTMKPSKMWECNTFVDFLEERLLNDDLHFFLHARNILYKGPHLQDIEAAQEPMYFVEQKQINSSIEIIFGNMPSFDVADIKKKFEQISADKSKDFSYAETMGNLPLDSSLVLRVFLEYYRNEKKAKQFIIKRLFKEVGGGQPNQSISFTQFKDVVAQIQPDINESDIAMLYRTSWMLGNGKVNFDTFFLAANETNFFVKCMQLRGQGKQPQLDHNFEIDQNYIGLSYEEQELAKQQHHVCQIWQTLEKQIKTIKDYVEQQGIEDFNKEFIHLDKLIKQKGQFDSSLMFSKDLIQIVRLLLSKIMLIRATYLEIQEQEPLLKKSGQELQKEMNIEQLQVMMNMIQQELNVLDELKSEDIQKIRNKERSGQNWSKLKETVQKKFTMVFKLNKF